MQLNIRMMLCSESVSTTSLELTACLLDGGLVCCNRSRNLTAPAVVEAYLGVEYPVHTACLPCSQAKCSKHGMLSVTPQAQIWSAGFRRLYCRRYPKKLLIAELVSMLSATYANAKSRLSTPRDLETAADSMVMWPLSAGMRPQQKQLRAATQQAEWNLASAL